MPPIPARRCSPRRGDVLYTRADIEQGRQVWQSIGGHQLGSIWGHGSYVAPDWSADWLHREAIAWLEHRRRGADRARLRRAPRRPAGRRDRAAARRSSARNTYDADNRHASRSTTSAPRRSPRWPRTTKRCSATTRRCSTLRKAYAMKQGTVTRRGTSPRAHGVHLVVRLGRGHRASRQARSPTPTTGRTSRWSAIRRRHICSCGRCSACCS